MTDTDHDEMNPDHYERTTNETAATKDEEGKSILGKRPSRCLRYYYLDNEEKSNGLANKVNMKSEKERDSGTAKKEVVLVDNSNDMVTVVCDEIMKGVNNHTRVKKRRIGGESSAKLMSLNMIRIDCVVIRVSTLNEMTATGI